MHLPQGCMLPWMHKVVMNNMYWFSGAPTQYYRWFFFAQIQHATHGWGSEGILIGVIRNKMCACWLVQPFIPIGCPLSPLTKACFSTLCFVHWWLSSVSFNYSPFLNTLFCSLIGQCSLCLKPATAPALSWTTSETVATEFTCVWASFKKGKLCWRVICTVKVMTEWYTWKTERRWECSPFRRWRQL